jgi:cytosine/adenosine deaminase-related metal-dependent hydrolase
MSPAGAERLLLREAEVLVTLDGARREIADGALLCEGSAIRCVGPTAQVEAWIAQDAAARAPQRTLSARGCVVLPGLINGHHHLYQTLTRSIGTGGGLALFDWLRRLYEVWAGVDGEAVYLSARLGLVELLLSGATTVADHLYLFPNGARLDDEIAAARELGVRFHPTRGSMSLGRSQGGLPPDHLVEDEDAILADCERLLGRFHDAAPHAMLRLGLAPCSPFSVSPQLMRDSAALARRHPRVGLHTHLAETLDEERYCLAQFGQRPLDYAASLGWTGPDVWFAHVVHASEHDIEQLAQTGTGVCHCPSSNMILASGIAPVRRMLDWGVGVGLGVDGSASNDGNHLLGEARQAMLLQRVGWPGFESRADRLSARAALELATLGGARILGRAAELGSLEAGKAADFVAFRVDDLAHAGALADPVAALLTCTPQRAWLSVINGRVVVEQGAIPGLDLEPLVRRHNAISARLLQRAGLQ